MKLKKLISGRFFKNLAILMSGTAIAQGLAFAASPILSRLYDPSAFGVFGLFIAATGIISVIASGKYELAIILPKKDEDAANILLLSLSIIICISIISFFLILLFRHSIAEILGSKDLVPLLWWAPVSIFFTGLYNVFNYWTTRRKQFKRLSISRVIQSSAREVTQLMTGRLSSLQGGGLVMGQLVGQAGSAGALIAQTYREDYPLIKKSYNKKRLYELAREYKDFPKYNAVQTFLNSISQNAPAILLAYFFSPVVVGLYWFTHRILFAPNQLIGNSLRQVFYQKANEVVKEGKSAFKIYISSTSSLVLLGIIPFFLILTGGPGIFSFIFGNEWIEAGRLAQWLIIWWFFLFINPPTIMMIPILNLQKVHFVISIAGIIFRIISIVIGGMFSSSTLAIALFSLVGAINNIILIGYISIKLNNE